MHLQLVHVEVRRAAACLPPTTQSPMANAPSRALLRRHLGLQLRRREPHDVLVLVGVELVGVGVVVLEARCGRPARRPSSARARARARGTPASPRARTARGSAQMSSCAVRPAWLSRITWSTPVASNSRRRRRIVSGEPISPLRSVSCALSVCAPLLVRLPHVALAGVRDAVPAVVAQAEHEERPARGLRQRLLVGRRAHEAADHRDVRIGRDSRRACARFCGQLEVVAVHPRPRGVRRHELEAERAHAPAAGVGDRL